MFYPRNNGFIAMFFIIINLILSTLIYLYYGPFFFNKKGQGDERARMRQMSAYQQILDESITRSMLKAFMRVLLQEERYSSI